MGVLGLLDGAKVAVGGVVDEDVDAAKDGQGGHGVGVERVLRVGEVVGEDVDARDLEGGGDAGRLADGGEDEVAFREGFEGKAEADAGVGAADVPDSGHGWGWGRARLRYGVGWRLR